MRIWTQSKAEQYFYLRSLSQYDPPYNFAITYLILCRTSLYSSFVSLSL